MKLLRLHSSNENALFDADFQNPLILKENAKIAFQNLSIESVNKQIEITSSNNKINFGITSGDDNQIELANDTYDRTNVNNLFDDMALKMNRKLEMATKHIGVQWFVTQTTGEKTNIEYKRSGLNEFANDWVLSNVRRVGGAWDATAAQTSANTNSGYLTKRMNKGCASFRAKIHRLNPIGANPIAQQGFIIALLTSNPANLGRDILDTDFKFAIHAPGEGELYRYYIDGVQYTSTTTVEQSNPVSDENNDYLQLSIDEGRVRGRVYTLSSPNGIILTDGANPLNIEYDGSADYYPVMIFRGDSTQAALNSLRFTQLLKASSPAQEFGEITLLATQPPVKGSQNVYNFLDFNAVELSRFLGYDFVRYPRTGLTLGPSSGYQYLAEKAFSSTIISDAFIVELLNLSVDGFDSYTKSKKNIIAVIPATDKDNLILYDAKQLVFLDLSNSAPITLRNLKARVVYTDYTSLQITGIATLTLVVDG